MHDWRVGGIAPHCAGLLHRDPVTDDGALCERVAGPSTNLWVILAWPRANPPRCTTCSSRWHRSQDEALAAVPTGQAAGRVVRTERDRGVVVLVGRRFARVDYTRLFPEDWEPSETAWPWLAVRDFFSESTSIAVGKGEA